MSRLCRLLNFKHGEDGQWAYREITTLRRELENERARDIHSCGPDCTRSGCVNRRLREELAEARQEIADLKCSN